MTILPNAEGAAGDPHILLLSSAGGWYAHLQHTERPGTDLEFSTGLILDLLDWVGNLRFVKLTEVVAKRMRTQVAGTSRLFEYPTAFCGIMPVRKGNRTGSRVDWLGEDLCSIGGWVRRSTLACADFLPLPAVACDARTS